MSNAVAWSEGIVAQESDERDGGRRRARVYSALILAAAAGLSGWLYLSVAPAGQADGRWQLNPTAISALAILVLGGIGCAVPPVLASRNSGQHKLQLLQERATHWQEMAVGLQNQLSAAQETASVFSARSLTDQSKYAPKYLPQ